MRLDLPLKQEDVDKLKIRDTVEIYGTIYCGRDAVLPKIVEAIKAGTLQEKNIDLEGSAIFHTAVSPAGIGPTSSNKADIEGSIPALSAGGVKLHIGKGALSKETVESLAEHGSVFLVTPPTSALLTSAIQSKECVAYPEEGMEAFYKLEVAGFPAIVASAKGESIF